MFNLAIYSGEMIGPTFGGFITNKSSFKTSCLSVSALNFMFGTLFYFINKEFINYDVKNGYRMHDNLNITAIEDKSEVIYNTRTNSLLSDFYEPYLNSKIPHSIRGSKKSVLYKI